MPRRKIPPPTFSPPDLDARWRPHHRVGPSCGYVFRGKICDKRGTHYCEPRADRIVSFFDELLVHTKGRWARRRFELDPWQEWEIIRPVFGEVTWSAEWRQYVRRYRVVHIVVARKNGKSELAAGIVLYLLVGDDEEGAEVYGAAKDTKQAGKVADVVNRMRQLSPTLSQRLGFNKNQRRIFDEKTGSYYEVITSDALGELGHNPHGFVLDEVLSQPDGALWDAMRTASGNRTQPLMILLTTETNEPHSFGADMIDEAERVAEDPKRAPHVLAFVRKIPADADPFDEDNWPLANPALGSFLSREALRQDALDARNDPSKENAYRQFRANQRVAQETRFLQLHIWDANAGEIFTGPDWRRKEYQGRRAWAGLDLSAKLDLTAWAVLTEDYTVFWRFFLPEAALIKLDRPLGGKLVSWARDGWVTVTDGDVIDYEKVYEAIAVDVEHFGLERGFYDKWSGEPVRQEILRRTGFGLEWSETTFARMTVPIEELRRLLQGRLLRHGANPVARWHADSLEVRRPRENGDRVVPVKPERNQAAKRIDGMTALLFAIEARLAWQAANEIDYDLMASVR